MCDSEQNRVRQCPTLTIYGVSTRPTNGSIARKFNMQHITARRSPRQRAHFNRLPIEAHRPIIVAPSATLVMGATASSLHLRFCDDSTQTFPKSDDATARNEVFNLSQYGSDQTENGGK